MDYQKNLRKNKEFVSFYKFSSELLVCCPNCSSIATVTMDKSSRASSPKFHCSVCFKHLGEDSWYGKGTLSPINENCDFCGVSIAGNYESVNKKANFMDIECKNCSKSKEYKAVFRRDSLDSFTAIDPYFGLQLWLQSGFDGNILWAYNKRHLDFLEEYIHAKLREEKAVNKYALAQNLPAFIIKASNRKKLLKLISKMNKTLA